MNKDKLALLALMILFSVSVYAQKPGTPSEPLPARAGTIAIPDGMYDGTLGTMACNTVTIATAGDVLDIDVAITMEHTWIGDVVVKLVSPAGTVNTLMSRPGEAEPADDGVSGGFGDSSDMVVGFPLTYSTTNGLVDAETMGSTILDAGVVCMDDSECMFTPNTGAGPGGPTNSFFAGEEGSGDWQVCVGDRANLDSGNLGSTILTLTQDGPPPVPPAPAVSVPTLAPIGLGILGLAFALFGVSAVRRRNSK